jgi:HK97 family phage prohead protease
MSLSKKIKETRTLNCAIEVRAEGEGESPVIAGYAALYNSRSENLGGFVETIRQGAFDEAAKRDDVRALINHDPNQVLGRSTSGTLRLMPDEKGLGIEIDPPNTQIARDLVELMRRGDVTQMSFSFSIRTEDQEWTQPPGDGTWLREIMRIDRLYDVAVVTYPAYPDTSAAVRTLMDSVIPNCEHKLASYRRSRLLDMFRVS